MAEKKGLTPEERGELNTPSDVFDGGKKARSERIAELREVHAGDSSAQGEIDSYDADSEYNKHIAEYRISFVIGDKNKQKELEEWFEQYHQAHS